MSRAVQCTASGKAGGEGWEALRPPHAPTSDWPATEERALDLSETHAAACVRGFVAQHGRPLLTAGSVQKLLPIQARQGMEPSQPR